MMKLDRIHIALAVFAFVGCGGGSPSGAPIDTETSVDGAVVQEIIDSIVPPTDVTVDVAVDAEPCVAGTGCFLEVCQGNSDCESGWCVPHQGERVCTKLCTIDCPDGWSCSPVSLAGADMSFICVSNYSHLCRPCNTNADCTGVGSTETVCVKYGDTGSFCGGACGGSFTECPFGYTCKNVETTHNIPTKQCVADSGSCTCTSTSIQLSLHTQCIVENADGTCTGNRVCTAEGLTPCDAGSPAVETCNGIDDDCDGHTDEESCDDGNGCTEDICHPETGCENKIINGGECIDGDPCTAADHCENGNCVGKPVFCNDDNECTDDFCTPEGGCQNAPNTIPCDDDNPCTVVDTCTEGACTGLELECDCLVNEDCGLFEDGNLCNGTLVCENTALPYRCVVDPQTVVDCSTQTGGETTCVSPQCVPESGECQMLPANEGLSCEDGDNCTTGDVCTSGGCVSGGPVNCSDDNVCTQDACHTGVGCLNVPVESACIDGNACTVGDTCTNGVCTPGAPVQCDDNNVCTDDTCVPETGCHYTQNTKGCNDGNVCTSGDQCAAGICTGLSIKTCDDNNPCTTDICDGVKGCTNTPNNAICNDGDVCTTGDQCSGGSCAGLTALACDDGNPCTDDGCTHPSGCTHVANAKVCEDGNECTTVDLCSGGACVGAGTLDCDDSNVCTNDSCKPGQGCQHSPIDVACDDGNGCTNGDLCSNGTCQAGTLIQCDDGNACTKDDCDPSTSSCVYQNQEGSCDDDNPCSIGDHCFSGNCTSTVSFDCEEGNPCTLDVCDPSIGCTHTAKEGACDDGNTCTSADLCTLGVCTGTPTNCDDNNPCTIDTCTSGIGCTYDPASSTCDDGNPCTQGDTCMKSQCVPGNIITSCDDNNPCTTDICNPVLGCQNLHTNGNCNDNDLCTINDICAQGVCSGETVVCDDGNACTDDDCDPTSGCNAAPNSAPCDDGDACTDDDQCVNGSCKAGGPLACDDNNTCTSDSCESETGCVYSISTPCCGNHELETGEECDDGNQIVDDDCDNACNYNYTVTGSYDIGSGPNWTVNPPTYSCTEACADVFGGTSADYHCSTSDTTLDHLAYLDGWNDTQYCITPADQDFKFGATYDCGTEGCSYSAYVEDHTENNPFSECQKTNWCWKKK